MDDKPPQLWTVGHGRLPIEQFLDNLGMNAIESIVDVRTTPASVWAPQYNLVVLKRALSDAGVSYVPMGKELGGRPQEPRYYDADGHVFYRELAKSERFRSGIARLEAGAQRFRVAVMCSEAEPTKCHRNLLIGRVLRQIGHPVTHILADGKTAPFDDHLVAAVGLPGFEEDPWRSLVQVRQDPRPNDSFAG